MPVNIKGSTTGSVELKAPDTGTDAVVTLPGTTMDLGAELAAKAPLAGSVRQVVYGFSTTEATNNSTTTYGDSGLSATITPTAATSKILVIVAQSFRMFGSPEASGSFKIVRGSTDIWTPGQNYAIAVGVQAGGSADMRSIWTMTYLDEPATTSATTYKIQYNRNVGTVIVQANTTRSSIILVEIAG